jgi:outer membrane immunogenic protein
MRHVSIVVIAAISTIAFTQFASAADLPRKAPAAPPPPPPFSWSGFYVGLNAGGGWRDPSDFVTVLTPCTITGNCTSGRVLGVTADQLLGSALGTGSGSRGGGFTGGGQIGYNKQFGNIVLGIEADIEYFKRSSSLTGTGIITTDPLSLTVTNHTDSNWLATVRPRLGYAWDRWLVYVTGGLALTKLEYTQTMVMTPLNPNLILIPGAEALSVSKTKAGWTIGGGLEFAIWNNWSIKAEYLYLQFSGLSGTSAFRLVDGSPFSNVVTGSTGTVRDNIVRAGLNYRFGGGPF